MFIIRRPAVWVAVILILISTVFNIIFKDDINKKRYYLDEKFGDRSRIETTIYGTFDSAVPNEKTTSIILKNVTLVFNGNDRQYNYLPAVIIYVKAEDAAIVKFNPGNKLSCNAMLTKIKTATNPGEFDLRSYYSEKKIYYSALCESEDVKITDSSYAHVKTLLNGLREKLKKIYGRCLPEKEAGIITAMLLGDKSMLDDEIETLYRENGLAHILAISGLHITVLCMAFRKFLMILRVPDKISIMLTVLLLFLYGTMTGFSVSTNRAVIMMVIALIGRFIGRSYDMMSAIAASAVVIVITKPMALFSCSFLLSYAAIISIALFYPFLRDDILGCKENLAHKSKENIIRYLLTEIKNMMLVSFSIQFFTTPVLLYYFFQSPSYGIVLNLLILPFSTLLVVLGALGGIAGMLCLPLASFVLGTVCFILKFYETVCKFFSTIPGHIIVSGRPSVLKIAVFYILIFIVMFLIRQISDYGYCGDNCSSRLLYISVRLNKWTKLIFGLFIVMYICIIMPVKVKNFSVSFLDVGQGDCIIIRNENGNVYMIDGGSSDKDKVGTYIIEPYLKYYGIDKIDCCIMTHADSDHISGIMEILEQKSSDGIKIEKFFLPEPDDELKDESYHKILRSAMKNCQEVRKIKSFDKIKDENLYITCMHPDIGYKADSANAYSTVLSVVHNKNSYLLTGDLEKDGEKQVIDKLKKSNNCFPKRYNVLKAAHHGSKNSTSEEFLKYIMPDVTVISCGKNNRYGHPHNSLIKRLEKIKTKIYRTDMIGAVCFEEESN